MSIYLVYFMRYIQKWNKKTLPNDDDDEDLKQQWTTFTRHLYEPELESMFVYRAIKTAPARLARTQLGQYKWQQTDREQLAIYE